MSIGSLNTFVVYCMTKLIRRTWEVENKRDALKVVVNDLKSVRGAAKKFIIHTDEQGQELGNAGKRRESIC